MARHEDRMIQWLRDAHAMEEQAMTLLNAQIGRIENYPELKQRLEQHLSETEGHVEKLEQCIERHNGGASAVKDTIAKMTAFAQGASGLFVGDEVAKGTLANYTFEHMEIASYRMLMAAADEVGDQETRRVAQDILREEEAMAKWLEDHLDEITRAYLERENTPKATAKR